MILSAAGLNVCKADYNHNRTFGEKNDKVD